MVGVDFVFMLTRADRTVPAKRLKEVVRLATEAGVSRVIIATTRTP